MKHSSSLLILLLLISTSSSASAASDAITPRTPLIDGKTIVSAAGTYELGFFSPENSNNRYIGIWYHNILPVQTVVWVANRANPITDRTGVFRISSNGTLILANSSNIPVWTSPASAGGDNSGPIAQLLESGNFVVSATGWQSFDYPTDTLLAGMKLGGSLKTGFNRYLTAWESSSDPNLGSYSFKMVPGGLPEFFLYR